MTGKIYMGVGVALWLIAWMFKDLVLTIGGGIFFTAGLLSLTAFNTGTDYTDTHYRLYRKILFVKTGTWRAIGEVHHVLVRAYSYIHHYPYTRDRFTRQPGKERVELYQVYFVRKNGYDKLFESGQPEEAQEFAEQLAQRYQKEIVQGRANAKDQRPGGASTI